MDHDRSKNENDNDNNDNAMEYGFHSMLSINVNNFEIDEERNQLTKEKEQ